MVKCLIRIRTKVNVHLRMINHCYRDVKVRVLNLGPRILARALGALPLFPALTGVISTALGSSREPGVTGEALSGLTLSAAESLDAEASGEAATGGTPSKQESSRETGLSGEEGPGWTRVTEDGSRETRVTGEDVLQRAKAATAGSREMGLSGETPNGWTPAKTEGGKENGVSGELMSGLVPATAENVQEAEEHIKVSYGMTPETAEGNKEMGKKSKTLGGREESSRLTRVPDEELTGWVPAAILSSDKKGVAAEVRKKQQEPVKYLQGLESLRDSAHSTPVRSSDHIDALSHGISRETVISDEAYTPCSSILPTPVCDHLLEPAFGQQVNGSPCTSQEEEGDVSVHSVPDTEVSPPALPGLEADSQRESESQGNKFLQSVLRLLAVTLCLLLALLLLLVILAESDLELAFLRDIRLTPEFQQFHYQYFCPLRRWLSCKLHPIIRLIDS